MPIANIVRGQRLNPGMLDRAKQMRREMTLAESALWEALRGNRLDGLHFRRQQVIDGYICDFYCHAASLVIETDGPIHDEQRGYDQERDETLARRGLLTMRVRNEEVERDLPGVLASIRERCRERT